MRMSETLAQERKHREQLVGARPPTHPQRRREGNVKSVQADIGGGGGDPFQMMTSAARAEWQTHRPGKISKLSGRRCMSITALLDAEIVVNSSRHRCSECKMMKKCISGFVSREIHVPLGFSLFHDLKVTSLLNRWQWL